MSKSIHTLVGDIYGLFSSDFTPSDTDIEQFGQELAKHLSRRIAEQRGEAYLRLSNIGYPCERKLWYSINTPHESEPLTPSTRIKFLIGDITEELLLFLAKQAGHDVQGEQDTLEIAGVKGHRDAVIDGVTVDVKSASSRSFDKFAEGKLSDSDDFGYLDQLGSYIFAGQNDPLVSEKDIGAFLVLDKQLGKICLDIHPRSGVDYEEVIEHKKQTVSQKNPPPRQFTPVAEGKSGNEKLPTVCSYCSFKHACWPGLRTFLYSNGPRYLTTVKREPDVVEVDRHGNFVERDN